MFLVGLTEEKTEFPRRKGLEQGEDGMVGFAMLSRYGPARGAALVGIDDVGGREVGLFIGGGCSSRVKCCVNKFVWVE